MEKEIRFGHDGIGRVFKEYVSPVKFEELWYADPGDSVLINDVVVIVQDYKYTGDQISFVDVKKGGKNEIPKEKAC